MTHGQTQICQTVTQRLKSHKSNDTHFLHELLSFPTNSLSRRGVTSKLTRPKGGANCKKKDGTSFFTHGVIVLRTERSFRSIKEYEFYKFSCEAANRRSLMVSLCSIMAGLLAGSGIPRPGTPFVPTTPRHPTVPPTTSQRPKISFFGLDSLLRPSYLFRELHACHAHQ